MSITKDWRFDWCVRTCISTAVATFLALYAESKKSINHNRKHDIGPSFVAFVTIMVKDYSFGATVKNGFGCLIGATLSTIVSVGALFVFSAVYSPTLFIFLGSVFSFLFQYVEFHPMGKKLAISLLTINFVNVCKADILDPCFFLEDVAIGMLLYTSIHHFCYRYVDESIH